ncbi:Hypothetical protein, putative [Bodo saltans]|uniref:Leucine-rich repeat protein n=1 Tax=Bodo saltans TaxID=75058 RepID=A0A0S4ISR4_BODSA|nr:Hypothetical protein, putative [Bodo saltans]|eukprot:CUG06174.1 Hypothetical protein, putative [Bodo saltans]
MRSDFSDFDLKNAAEMEAHINMNATAAKINFDKYYKERLNDPSRLWREVRRRLDVRDVLEVPALVLDVGVPKFDYTSIGQLFSQKLLEREKNKEARAADGNPEASLTVNVKMNMNDPFKLVLSGCDYTNLDKVVSSIVSNQEITHLSFANNGLDTDDCEALAKFIASNTTVVALDLSGNKLGGEQIQKLADALAKNSTITDLDLGANGLAKSAAKAFAAAISVPTCQVSRLQLAGNALGIYGVEELAVGLRQNTSIKALGLQNNNIGNDGAQKLLDVLPGKGQSIDEVFADGSLPINDVDGSGVATEKKFNTSLVQVSIEANRVDDSLALAVATGTWLNEQVQMRRHMIRLETEARAMLEDVDPELDALRLFFAKATSELVAALAAKAAEAAAAPKAAPGKSGAKGPAAKPSPAGGARSASKSPVKAAPAKGKAPPPPAASTKVKAAAGAGRTPSPKKGGA